MSNYQTVDFQPVADNAVATSSAWGIAMEDRNVLPGARAFSLAPAALALALALLAWPRSATTDAAQLWAKDQRRSAATVTTELETVVGRAVSRAEAIRIAHGILKRAEQERLTLAENEARRGIQWENE